MPALFDPACSRLVSAPGVRTDRQRHRGKSNAYRPRPRRLFWTLLLGAATVLAAPDEELLGKAAGYPAARTHAQAFQEPYRVGSFSAMDSIAPHCTLAVGKALEEGLIRSLDDPLARYLPALAGTLYGDSRILHLLRMSSGARFVEDYSGTDDHAIFNRVQRESGALQAARLVRERAAPAGERFNYASAETQMLGLLLRAATGRTLCDYVADKIWQPMGAQARATWLVNPRDGVELAGGNFNATPRDYARLGWLLANDGVAGGKHVIAVDYLLDMTDASRQPEAFRPGRMQNRGSTFLGYGLQVWLMPGSHRRFVLLGNRHVPIELQPDHLKIEPDHVLAELLRAMHLIVREHTLAFEPEGGAYAAQGHAHHDHDQAHDHGHKH